MIKQSEGHWNASKGSALQRLTGLIAVAMLISALGLEFSKPTAELLSPQVFGVGGTVNLGCAYGVLRSVARSADDSTKWSPLALRHVRPWLE
jgi:hypothetical protein